MKFNAKKEFEKIGKKRGEKRMNKKVERIPVAIYIRCNVEKGEDSFRKERFLRDYCEKKGYDIIEVFRDTDVLYEEDLDWEEYSTTMRDIIASRYCKYQRIIALEVGEFSQVGEMLCGFYEVLLDRKILIETVKDGILGADILFGVTVHSNVMNKVELEKAQSISFSEEPF